MNNLRERATAGILWSAFERIGQQGCVLIVQIVLARILEPQQFGLIAMVSVFVVIAGALVDSGLGAAIIQKKSLSATELSTVFWFNLGAAAAMAGMLWGIAPFVAWFYAQPELTAILRALGLGLVFGSVGSVPGSILKRDMGFKSLFWASMPSAVISGAIGIGLALGGYGVWALVGQSLSQNAVGSLTLWLQARWRPRWSFDWSALKGMLPFGARLAASQVLDRGFQNLYVLVIGKVFSAAEVGFFQRAFSLQQFLMGNLQALIGNVAFPLLSSLQHEPARMRRVVETSVHLIGLTAFAVMAVVAAAAEPLVLTLLGDKWLPCVPMLQWMCVIGALYPLHATNLSVLQALGRSDRFLQLEVIKKALTLANVALTYRFGIHAMIIGMVVNSFLGLAVNTYYTRRFINFGLRAQLQALLPFVGLAIVLFGSVIALSRWVPMTPPLQLLLAAAWSSVVLLAAMRIMPAIVRFEVNALLKRFSWGPRFSNLVLGRS